ncbi:hypothetical protein D9M71_625540 [compost metagenome]
MRIRLSHLPARWRAALDRLAGDRGAGRGRPTGEDGRHQHGQHRAHAHRSSPAQQRRTLSRHLRTDLGRPGLHRPGWRLAAGQRQPLRTAGLQLRRTVRDDLPGHHPPRRSGEESRIAGATAGRPDRPLRSGKARAPPRRQPPLGSRAHLAATAGWCAQPLNQRLRRHQRRTGRA